MAEPTPLMRQYGEMKARHPDAILFFRVGDFYEMFGEDAVEASRILEITLTSRDKGKEDAVPLCGIPYHAAESYLAKLIRAGKNVAICDQVEDPKLAKGLVRREIVRVLTPGTLVEPSLLDARENNYLAAVFATDREAGLALADCSTGEFRLALSVGPGSLGKIAGELSRCAPSEIIFPRSATGALSTSLQTAAPQASLRAVEDAWFDGEDARRRLREQFGDPMEQASPWRESVSASAAGALMAYVRDTQPSAIGHLRLPEMIRLSDTMGLDDTARRNLELTRRLSDGNRSGTLLSVLDRTQTAMGARRLRDWILHPLTDPEEIARRLDRVEALTKDGFLRDGLRKRLADLSDIERLTGRIVQHAATPRDLVALRRTLEALPGIEKLLRERGQERDCQPENGWDNLDDAAGRIAQTITDDPPAAIKDGGVIRDGHDPELNEARALRREGKQGMARIEAQERRRTGIDSLKVRYNQVFGYYIEVAKSQLARVPDDFTRKQTLANAERFITPELKRWEESVLGAEARITARESELFEELRAELARHARRLQAVSDALARLDAFASLAETAVRNRYCRPFVDAGRTLSIVEGRHPVLEEASGSGRFVPNDTLLDGESRRMIILTGPNMAGKSTYMRQAALIALMAQVGSFVPAKAATVGVVDQIFTRVGASDDLVGGRSTFMVEMTETAEILRRATNRSLILLDEIGRGTSTFDGVSIAWAVSEHVAGLRARTIFATHYHELAELARTQEGVRALAMSVREWNDEIVFLRKVVEGAADKSYGIHVARLAGLPSSVLERARAVLRNLETNAVNEEGKPRLSVAAPETSRGPAQEDLFSPRESPVLSQIRDLDVDRLAPIDALLLLQDLKRKALEDPP